MWTKYPQYCIWPDFLETFKSYYFIIDWVYLGIPKWCILGYLTTCPIESKDSLSMRGSKFLFYMLYLYMFILIKDLEPGIFCYIIMLWFWSQWRLYYLGWSIVRDKDVHRIRFTKCILFDKNKHKSLILQPGSEWDN